MTAPGAPAGDRARERVRWYLRQAHSRDGLSPDQEMSRWENYCLLLEEWEGYRFKTIFPGDDEITELVKKAYADDFSSHLNLLCIATPALLTGSSMPRALSVYLSRCLNRPPREPRPQRGRPRSPSDNRDINIAVAVRLAQRAGLGTTRNRASRRPSACSVVAEELRAFGVHMTEAAVEKIWYARASKYDTRERPT
jgi:hypothetical protein